MGQIADRLAGAKPAERTVPVCLRMDLVGQLQALERELFDAQAAAKAANSLNAGARSRTLAEQIETLRAQMADETVTFTLRALTPRTEWRKLLAAHPPRENNTDDAVGVNTDTFWDAAIRATTVDPVMDEADWKALDGFGSDGQWNTLAAAAWAVNTSDVDIPFSRIASRVIQESENE